MPQDIIQNLRPSMPYRTASCIRTRGSTGELGQRIGRNQATVMRICPRWIQEKTTEQRGQSPPSRCATAREDRRIVRMAVMDHAATSRTIAQRIQSVTHHSECSCTIRHHL
ncbi:transposable element Tcb1 transposase [Trichonephila clavipes]|nr:transposable element Tcb1 transposase [Trichonephila clavipes]